MRVRRTPMLPSLPLGPCPPRGDDRVKGAVSSTRLATRKRAARSGYRATPSALRPPRSGLVQRTMFALLYGLGLRVGEVARLQRADVDLARAVLCVRATKFGKSRLVPFGPRMAA